MTVWLVMGNDRPDGIFATEEAAERYCQAQLDDKKYGQRIYWRTYQFKVRSA